MARFRSDAAWRHFVAWCRLRRLRPLPANAWTIAAYARACERRFGSDAVVARIGSIARAHLMQGHAAADRHPTVERTLSAIAQQARLLGEASDLFDPADFLHPEKPSQPKPTPRITKPRMPRQGLRGTPPLVRHRPPSGTKAKGTKSGLHEK